MVFVHDSGTTACRAHPFTLQCASGHRRRICNWSQLDALIDACTGYACMSGSPSLSRFEIPYVGTADLQLAIRWKQNSSQTFSIIECSSIWPPTQRCPVVGPSKIDPLMDTTITGRIHLLSLSSVSSGHTSFNSGRCSSELNFFMACSILSSIMKSGDIERGSKRLLFLFIRYCRSLLEVTASSWWMISFILHTYSLFLHCTWSEFSPHCKQHCLETTCDDYLVRYSERKQTWQRISVDQSNLRTPRQQKFGRPKKFNWSCTQPRSEEDETKARESITGTIYSCVTHDTSCLSLSLSLSIAIRPAAKQSKRRASLSVKCSRACS